ncbi:TPA: hypothetical protein L4F62_004126 [Pseudomonas aeruginosa]|uniref:hypothetical protein n=1 Tax=Pseudomonas aeruginosa TaxID=287 RepID=UPI0015B96A77|nr:hypothetical protein [Pseudomonas aeruginosa]CAI9794610.1 ADF-H domain-containing protein [Pseudomonas aeruginosa]CAI9911999.1 ADF-H domain-containing protein [Pseudomonas aeruginosa]HBO1617621.1 hypothetical protein [Pseudomonas aeruginosa]
MKKAEIGKGRYYSDGKIGLREVLDEGPQYKLYDGVEDDDCLRYRCLNAKAATDIGQESSSTRTSFAAWAKAEIPAEEVQAHLLKLQAKKIARKLTEPQRLFLLTFDSDLTEGDGVECARSEFRAAASCREKGIIASMPDKLDVGDRYFDVNFSPLGLAVLESVLLD